jgi:hypothetical protein
MYVCMYVWLCIICNNNMYKACMYVCMACITSTCMAMYVCMYVWLMYNYVCMYLYVCMYGLCM